MKTKNLFKALFLGLLLTAYTGYVKSQGCGMYYPLSNGTELQMTNYDGSGNVNGTSTSTVTNASTNAESSVATIVTTSKDKTDKTIGTSSYSVKCTGGSIFVEMKSFAGGAISQWNNMAVKTDATFMELPQTLTVGMTLKDGTGTISVYNNGTLFTTMKINITNRKVASKESITTPAGTFQCFKITQDISVETTMMGMTVPVNAKSVEYYAINTGLVKSESYDKDNKLTGYSLLTKITKAL